MNKFRIAYHLMGTAAIVAACLQKHNKLFLPLILIGVSYILTALTQKSITGIKVLIALILLTAIIVTAIING